ncbi:MAG: GAF domain-containing protein [Rhodococcus sp. (in: high G+C Gram-positive bacteria)]
MTEAQRVAGPGPDSYDGWVVVETLVDPTGQEGPLGTVVAKDGRPKNWTALQRSVPNRHAADAARRLVAAVVETAEVQSTSVPGLAGPLLAVPVRGPSRAVHGVLLYTGDDPESQPPAVAGWDWSSADRHFFYTPDIDRIVPPRKDDRYAATSFEFFDRVNDPDTAMYMIAALLDAEPGSSWDGGFAVRTPAGPAPIRNVFRTVRDEASPRDSISRGLAIPLRSDEMAMHGPSFESMALRTLSRNSTTAIALVDAERVRLVRWLTEPVPNVLWKGQLDRRDTPHPEDIERIVSTYLRMGDWIDRGTTIPNVRLRRVDTGWTVVDLRATQIPGQPFLMVEFETVGHSNEPDPVPPDDTGYPGRGRRPR